VQEGARVVSGRAELSREDTCTRRFFFAKREDVLNWSTVQPPFYNQIPEEKKNYKAVHMTTVHLPRELPGVTRRNFLLSIFHHETPNLGTAA